MLLDNRLSALLKLDATLLLTLLKSAILVEAPLLEGVPASETGTLLAMLLDKLKLDATLVALLKLDIQLARPLSAGGPTSGTGTTLMSAMPLDSILLATLLAR